DNSISLNKFISSTGICSRRGADKWIDDERVHLNGIVAKKGNRVFPGDEVLVDGKQLENKPKAIYLALNKPPGITCTTDLKDRDNIIDFIGYPQRIFPIGRLDKPSSGLILLTNDGDIVNKILRKENNHDKEYIVRVDRLVTEEFIRKMSNGIPILDTVTDKCTVERINDYVFRIILTQGLNRQIRRMCEYLDYKVIGLKRVRIMNIKLGKMELGTWRDLTDQELHYLNESLSNS
ncbi:UNVERIFIED_CONTAM: hypothetical protein GTU68_013714, partial [Idotea baltica]|nr:hypothetical protein [Idotea baltica]